VLDTDVAVVGGGPAGITAALAAAQTGARVTLVDEYPLPGGQMYRQPPPQFRGGPRRSGPRLLDALRKSSVAVLSDTLVYGVEDGHELSIYREGAGADQLRARAVVVATGGYDRPIAFPGWTLPGVFTAGGLQALVKGQYVLPGRRVLLAGAGPFLMPVAMALSEAGATVVAVVEATTRRQWLGNAARLWRYVPQLRDAIGFQLSLARAAIPYYFGHILVSARGRNAVEGVTIAAVDRQWLPRAGTYRHLVVDCVGVGYGFMASTELARLMGCALRFAVDQDQFFPWHGVDMETSVPGVFVAGETTGIGGAALAQVEGQIAGWGAARHTGQRLTSEHQRELEAARKQRASLQCFADTLNRLFRLRPGVYQLPQPETILCRCEEVSFGDARQAIRHGVTTANGLKGQVRVGMGPCQGRMCSPLVAQLISDERGMSLEQVGTFTPRPPIKPIPLGAVRAPQSDERELGDA